MAKLQDEVNTVNQVSTNRNDQDLGERFFFFLSLIPKFRAVANVVFVLSAIPFWTRATDFAERRGAARSLARKGRGVWERMKIILWGSEERKSEK